MELVFHLVVPLALLALAGVKIHSRHVPFFLFLAILPDLDRFFGMRREAFTNVFFPFVVAALVYGIFLVKRHPKAQLYSLLALYFVGSHILLDLGGPVALFYPFSTKLYELEFLLQLRNYLPALTLNVLVYEEIPQGVGGIMKTEGLMITILAVIVFSVTSLSRRRKHL